MEKKKAETTEKYTVGKLFTDICNQYEAELEAGGEDLMRDKIYKLNILNRIMILVESVNQNNEIAPQVSSCIAENADFYGYTYFLSANQQFNYSWSYLRKQWVAYEKKLDCIVKFLMFMISVVNAVCPQSDELEDYKFMFSDVFEMSLNKECHSPVVNVSWENMNNLFLVDKGFTVSVKRYGIVLLSKYYNERKKDDVAQFSKCLKETLGKLSFVEG